MKMDLPYSPYKISWSGGPALPDHFYIFFGSLLTWAVFPGEFFGRGLKNERGYIIIA